MQKILSAHFQYNLYKDGSDYYLRALYGGAAMQTIVVKLTSTEISQYQQDGQGYIDNLWRDVKNFTSTYEDRRIPNDEIDFGD